MAFGSNAVIERFCSDFFEEQDGQMFLRPPKGKEHSVPISNELYLELVDAHETDLRIATVLAFVCIICGLLFGAYRWLAMDDLLQVFLFAGLGFVACQIGNFVMSMRAPLRMGLIYQARLKLSSTNRSKAASTDDLFWSMEGSIAPCAMQDLAAKGAGKKPNPVSSTGRQNGR